MKINPLLLVCLLLCLTNCSRSVSNSKKKNDLKIDSLSSVEKKNELIIQNKCAVIYNPDSLKIEIMKKSGEEDFYTAADDAMYYISQTRVFLEKHYIKVIETDSHVLDFYINGKIKVLRDLI